MKQSLAVGAVMVTLGVAGGLARAEDISGSHRLLESFVEDGAMVRQGWMEARGSYSNWGGGHDLGVGAVLAFRAVENLEIGGRFGYLDRSRSRDKVLFGERLTGTEDGNGLSDLDLYAKYRLSQAPQETSLGLLVKLPTADEKDRLGSGSSDYELFAATRRTLKNFAWVGNAGARLNGDARTPGGGEGRTSLALGGGALFKLAHACTFMAEARYETRRYSGGDPSLTLTPSVDFRPTENLSFRVGVAFGAADGSPNQEAIFGAVFHF